MLLVATAKPCIFAVAASIAKTPWASRYGASRSLVPARAVRIEPGQSTAVPSRKDARQPASGAIPTPTPAQPLTGHVRMTPPSNRSRNQVVVFCSACQATLVMQPAEVKCRVESFSSPPNEGPRQAHPNGALEVTAVLKNQPFKRSIGDSMNCQLIQPAQTDSTNTAIAATIKFMSGQCQSTILLIGQAYR